MSMRKQYTNLLAILFISFGTVTAQSRYEPRYESQSEYRSHVPREGHRREIVIPEQRYVFDETEEDLQELKHLLELADLVAYENTDNTNGEYVPPTYIGRHNARINKAETPIVPVSEPLLGGSHKHFFKDSHGVVQETCVSDSDCTEQGYVCGINKPGVCGHKDVFPTDAIEMLGVFTFAFIMGLCTVAGIGGGGIAISLIIAFFNFTTKPAVAISSLSILVCTTMRFIYNFKTMNPEKKGVVLVDYSLVTLMMPTTIAGSQLGSIILKVCPAIFIQIMLTVLLAFLTVQSFRKALDLHKKEQQEILTARHSSENSISPARLLRSGPDHQTTDESKRHDLNSETELSTVTTEPTTATSRRSITTTTSSEIGSEQNVTSPKPLLENRKQTVTIAGKEFPIGNSWRNENELSQLADIVKAESGHFQPVKQGICLFMLSCVITMNLLMPSEHSPSIIGIERCSGHQFSLQLGFLVTCTMVTLIAIRINQREQHLKIKYNVNYKNGDIKFSGNALMQLTCLGFVGGLVAGALGLGGGSIYNPALLTLGVHPKVSGATGMFLVLFSTINTCLVNYLNGFLHLNYGVWISLWSLIGSIIGMNMTDRVVQVTGKPSILVWILVAVFVMSTVATPIFGGIDLYSLHKRGEDIFAFSGYCSS